ncbi:hypothetical protein EA007_00555 [Vibrio anguillarum]|nr:hypothetical protein [Vibrio anguillarum]
MLGESIYVPHSSEVVNEVMSEFRDFMHDSECTSLALQKSLELLNFFTYRSDLDDNQKDRFVIEDFQTASFDTNASHRYEVNFFVRVGHRQEK